MPVFETIAHILCKYSFLVLIFGFLGGLQISYFEPLLKKLLGFGTDKDQKVKKEDLLIKTIVFVVGIFILFVLFRDKLTKCAKL